MTRAGALTILTLMACGRGAQPEPSTATVTPRPTAAEWPSDPASATKIALSPPGLDAARPRVSPDGSAVVYHAGAVGARDIYLVAATGGEPRILAPHDADDRDPTWSRDGAQVIFASNRGGFYDLYAVDVGGDETARALNVGSEDAGASEPSVSPLSYTFSAVAPDQCTDSGATAFEVDSYDKLVFTRTDDRGKAVWFASLNGRHRGRLSPKGADCWGGRYSGDGLSLTMTCAGSGGDRARVVHDTRATWDWSLADALRAVGYDDGDESSSGCDGDPEHWNRDSCLKRLPRHYSRHAPHPLVAGRGEFEAVGYSTNQTLVLGRSATGAATYLRGDDQSWQPLEVAPAARLGSFDWSPDGSSVVAEEETADGARRIVVIPTAYPLQDVKDLVDYPELWLARRSERMEENRFVVRPGGEKEFFTAYDKIMYARRAPFVTADAMLQVLRDEVAMLLEGAERDAASALLRISEKLTRAYLARGDDAVSRFFANHFAVAWGVLAAANAAPLAEVGYVYEDHPEPSVPPTEQIKAQLEGALAELPASVRDRARRSIEMALAHEGISRVKVPGRSRPVPVDFSQMKPRGHYAESTLAGYFIAMKWLSMIPLPLDEHGMGLVQMMKREGLVADWRRIDTMIGGFMGRPVDVTVSHVLELMEEEPQLLAPFDKKRVHAALKSKLGDLGIRGLEQALADQDGRPAPKAEPPLMFFPLRLGADVPMFAGLTNPAVAGRGLPSSVDVLATLGAEAAMRIARAEAEGEIWQRDYLTELEALRAKTPGANDPLWATDLYHSWLALLRTLATPMKAPDAARLLFAENDAWGDRLVSAALAGYAQLKHAAVLYAYQDFSVQCDGLGSIMVFVEQPILPKPRGFVEPNPEFFRAVAALAKRAYATLSPNGEEPKAHVYAWDEDDRTPVNARMLAERLEAIARLQLRGLPPTDGDIELLRTIGGTMETLFLMQEKITGQFSGAARQKHGVALATDIHTNVTRQEALTIGVGRLDRILVAVPDTVGARMTEGAVFSFFETTQPISDRLTDLQWNEMIVKGELPPRPRWVLSFFEEVELEDSR